MHTMAAPALGPPASRLASSSARFEKYEKLATGTASRHPGRWFGAKWHYSCSMSHQASVHDSRVYGKVLQKCRQPSPLLGCRCHRDYSALPSHWNLVKPRKPLKRLPLKTQRERRNGATMSHSGMVWDLDCLCRRLAGVLAQRLAAAGVSVIARVQSWVSMSLEAVSDARWGNNSKQ